MAFARPVIVHVEKPANILLCEYFVEMRIWLDAHKSHRSISASSAAPSSV